MILGHENFIILNYVNNTLKKSNKNGFYPFKTSKKHEK
tara:strand:- start:788 stop:901 length:114 start_codon:yes stop_codon:yes gene_type:complete